MKKVSDVRKSQTIKDYIFFSQVECILQAIMDLKTYLFINENIYTRAKKRQSC